MSWHGRKTGPQRRNIAADRALQYDALLEQRLLQLERLDLLGEQRGVEIDVCALVEIAGGIGAVGDGRRIAPPADAGNTRPVLPFDQLQLGDQAPGGAVSGVQPGLIFVAQPLPGGALDRDVAWLRSKIGKLREKDGPAV